MSSFSISYLKWHYGRAYKELYQNIARIVLFLFDFFSIIALTQKLFSHEAKMDRKSRRFYLLFAFKKILDKTLYALGRLGLILLGLMAAALAILAGIFTFFIWTFLPIIVVYFFIFGLRLFLR